MIMNFNKKSEAGLGAILVVIIIVLFLGWLITFSQRECRTNKDCGAEAYCGSDFACHSYPTIQKTIVQYNLLLPSVIIGIAIVVAAVILKRNAFKSTDVITKQPKTETRKEEVTEVDEITESYYKSEGNIKTP